MPLWARQGLVIAAGGAVAVVMIWLGLWQSQVFTDQGNASAQARAQQQAVPLLDHIAADGTVGDIYGKPVTVNGRYLRDQQELVLGPDGVVRVLTALQLADGRVLPVVRGTLAPGTRPPVPPAGDLELQGIFLPSEAASDHPLTRGYTLGSVRLAQLAQAWPQPLLPGFITLTAAEAKGLQPAPVALPSGDGSWRNSGYALQWWVFALFGFGMTLKIAQSMGRRERRAAGAATIDGS